MRFVHLLMVLCVAYGSYHFWQQHQISRQIRAATDESGFIEMPTPDGQDQTIVYVIAAENCPHEDAQRADRLAAALSEEHIPVQRSHHVGFSAIHDNAEAARVNTVMNGELPIVFVHGRAKSNPTLEDVQNEIKKYTHLFQ